MCTEPLLHNIEENPRIGSVVSMNSALCPKFAIADDTNAITSNNLNSVQVEELFNEHGRCTEASGLELNADKTEIMRLNFRSKNQISFDIVYVNNPYTINTLKEIMFLFQPDEPQMIDSSIDSVAKKIDAILRKWSVRHLSLFGKFRSLKLFVYRK